MISNPPIKRKEKKSTFAGRKRDLRTRYGQKVNTILDDKNNQ